MVGMCGVVVMDMASGRELVLMRVQRCRRHGVGFVMVGWTVLDRPLDSDVDLQAARSGTLSNVGESVSDDDGSSVDGARVDKGSSAR